MKAVLYTSDMEPITIVDLPGFAFDMLRGRGQVVMNVMDPVCKWFVGTPIDSSDESARHFARLEVKRVRITAEPLVRRGQRSLMLFTEDDENALLLKAAFLPGQEYALQERASKEFARGFMAALGASGALG